jgi:hypothetical protein
MAGDRAMNELVIDAAVVSPMEVTLAEHAAVIRALGKRVVGDIIEIGRRLTDAKRIAGHGGWLPWLQREFGWSDSAALKFMQVHEMVTKSVKFTDLDLPVSGLYLLAAPSTPEEAREAVIERAANGEALSLKEVQRMIDQAKQKQADDYEQRLRALTEKHKREAARDGAVLLSLALQYGEPSWTTSRARSHATSKAHYHPSSARWWIG